MKPTTAASRNALPANNRRCSIHIATLHFCRRLTTLNYSVSFNALAMYLSTSGGRSRHLWIYLVNVDLPNCFDPPVLASRPDCLVASLLLILGVALTAECRNAPAERQLTLVTHHFFYLRIEEDNLSISGTWFTVPKINVNSLNINYALESGICSGRETIISNHCVA